MKLLLDENLSFRVIPSLQATYPGSTQVKLVGLQRADDRAIWAFAKAKDYVIVTKDDDFQGLLGIAGYPPKVIRLLMGNSANITVIDALLHNASAIINALKDPNIGLIEIY
jgi:predicted nuclease of predicted toxin-antitoxin system